MPTDVHVCDHGSVVVLNPVSHAGRTWLDANINPDALRWGGGIVCEPRYVGAIIEGLIADELEVSA